MVTVTQRPSLRVTRFRRRLLTAAVPAGLLAGLVLRVAYLRCHQPELRTDGAQAVLDHLTECTDADAAIVVDGNADFEVAGLLAAGWTIEHRVDLVAGKRVRYLHPPAADSPVTIFRALRGDDHGR